MSLAKTTLRDLADFIEILNDNAPLSFYVSLLEVRDPDSDELIGRIVEDGSGENFVFEPETRWGA